MDGEPSRDFTFVDNVVHANLLAARRKEPIGGEVLNVGCGERITVNRLAKMMANALGHPDLEPLHHPERAGDLKHSYADLKHSREILGYEPVVPFEPGLKRTLEWYAWRQGRMHRVRTRDGVHFEEVRASSPRHRGTTRLPLLAVMGWGKIDGLINKS